MVILYDSYFLIGMANSNKGPTRFFGEYIYQLVFITDKQSVG